jgi:branched-chain amino acid transport system substrate-binding protein
VAPQNPGTLDAGQVRAMFDRIASRYDVMNTVMTAGLHHHWRARAVALYLRQAKFDKIYAIGMDYAWGRNSVGVFKSEMGRANKECLGEVFSPIGTKDFATYITKIRQSGADACYVTMAGDDYNAFLAQAAQYELPKKVQLLSEVVDLTVPRAVGDAALGLISSMRYCFRADNPKNKEFVALWEKEYGAIPDNNEGEQWQALQVLAAGIEKAGSSETAPLRAALETVAITPSYAAENNRAGHDDRSRGGAANTSIK